MPQYAPGQTLLIDADDTLWENNVYFERAIAAFISYLNHHKYSPAEVRNALNAVERETVLSHGYGLPSFTHALLTCFERLSPAPITEEKRQRILGFVRSIAEQEIERTKPKMREQSGKIERSGLAHHFYAVEIVAEKDPPTYREVIHRHQVASQTRSTTQTHWMIGNSPKSDINPALAAGINAVFLFHKDTWILEHATLDSAPPGQQLIELDSFAKLCSIF